VVQLWIIRSQISRDTYENTCKIDYYRVSIPRQVDDIHPVFHAVDSLDEPNISSSFLSSKEQSIPKTWDPYSVAMKNECILAHTECYHWLVLFKFD
jgi:hypothetical protein